MSGSPTSLQRLLLAAYPPSFRARYGAELESLVTDCGASPRVVLDLAVGAIKAWLLPIGPPESRQRRRWRLEATSGTVFVAWCVALVAMAGFSRGVDDSPLPGLAAAPTSAFFAVAETAFSLSVAVVALGLLFYAAAVLVPAVRAHQRRVWLPVALPLLASMLWALSSVAVSALVQRFAGNGPSPDPRVLAPALAALLAWLAIGGLCLCAGAFGAPLALRRAHLSERLLLPGAIGGVLIATALAVSSVTSLACVVELSRHNAAGDLLPAAVGVALLLVTAGVTATSAVRGALALRGGVGSS